MKVFNEEPDKNKKPDAYILVLNKKEAKLLIEMAEAAKITHTRRTWFKKIHKELEEKLACY